VVQFAAVLETETTRQSLIDIDRELMRNLILKTLLLILIFTPSMLIAEQTPKAFFDQRLNEVFSKLRENPENYKNLDTLVPLAEEYILNHWDIDATLLAMIGRTHWESIASNDKVALNQAFRTTMLRYFLEAYSYYDGQPVELTDVSLNKAEDKGWLRINIVLDYAPDIPVDISIAKKDGQWLFRDIRFQGIRYTYMKRDFYQGTIEDKGVSGLIDSLNQKNLHFFQVLEQATAANRAAEAHSAIISSSK